MLHGPENKLHFFLFPFNTVLLNYEKKKFSRETNKIRNCEVYLGYFMVVVFGFFHFFMKYFTDKKIHCFWAYFNLCQILCKFLNSGKFYLNWQFFMLKLNFLSIWSKVFDHIFFSKIFFFSSKEGTPNIKNFLVEFYFNFYWIFVMLFRE